MHAQPMHRPFMPAAYAAASPPVTLRPAAEHDNDPLETLLKDPHTQRHTLLINSDDITQLPRYLEDFDAGWHHGLTGWVIGPDDADGFFGIIVLRRRDPKNVELGCIVTPEARGNGIARRACHAAATFAFDALKVARLEMRVRTDDHKGRLLAQRLGFRPEGVARAAAGDSEDPCDAWTAGLLAGELAELAHEPDGYALARRRGDLLLEPQPVLHTDLPQLQLRPLTPADIDPLTRACQDPETARWTTIPQPYNRDHSVGFVTEIARDGWRTGSTAIFAIADETGYCGTIDLRMDNPDPLIAEIGYNTAPWARGRGYMTHAVRTITRYAFDAFGFERVEWRAMVGNDASRRVAEKAGFTFEGVARCATQHRDERPDFWVGAVIRGDSVT